MVNRLGITIRIGATQDSVITQDGAVFDRSCMTRSERKKLTRLVRDVYQLHLERK